METSSATNSAMKDKSSNFEAINLEKISSIHEGSVYTNKESGP